MRFNLVSILEFRCSSFHWVMRLVVFLFVQLFVKNNINFRYLPKPVFKCCFVSVSLFEVGRDRLILIQVLQIGLRYEILIYKFLLTELLNVTNLISFLAYILTKTLVKDLTM